MYHAINSAGTCTMYKQHKFCSSKFLQLFDTLTNLYGGGDVGLVQHWVIPEGNTRHCGGGG